ncbi:uncharacterized protein LOC123264334 [Cotesia glomerata]|uniref:Uncharacterized protein n=1 Tax=Cotesia glomerata TaxID=32391 RepID=A0AAV7I971_COTGL|nr:uncharacterized protein LOC123264334 [Cotesia glomerata]KAH0555106.1 hypothetical protein KQX54_015278 [Cotesia glomerata]
MRGFILILIHSIAIIECENQVGSQIQFPKDPNGQIQDTKFHSQTRFESSNQKLQVKSPGILSKFDSECNCPEKTYIVFSSADSMKKFQRRSSSGGRMVEHPFYVDEPGWVMLSESNTNLMSNDNKLIKADQDPFYLARGRKSSMTVNFPFSNEKKRSFNLKDRQKRSDISDLLHEPFFISRGKKKSYNDYYYHRGDTRVNENNRGIYLYDKRNEGSDNNGYSYKLLEDNKDTDGQSRGRRDFFDQLLRENDPFYVTRG